MGTIISRHIDSRRHLHTDSLTIPSNSTSTHQTDQLLNGFRLVADLFAFFFLPGLTGTLFDLSPGYAQRRFTTIMQASTRHCETPMIHNSLPLLLSTVFLDNL
jgi:hypothetical protein